MSERATQSNAAERERSAANVSRFIKRNLRNPLERWHS